jgi:HPt (histidine-containing phosphotransfer) domain-containing protein
LADVYAIITLKTGANFFGAQALVAVSVDLQDTLAELNIFLLPTGWHGTDVFVIGASVDVQNPAKNGDGMLTRKRLDGG